MKRMTALTYNMKLIAILLLLCCLLSGCVTSPQQTGSISTSTETLPADPRDTTPTDPSPAIDPSLPRPQDRGFNFVETEDAYYYLFNQMVYVSQKDEPSFYYLCGKPDCPHDGPDCNAFADMALGYWNGKLYGVDLSGDDEQRDWRIFSMNLDGSEHRRVANIELLVSKNGLKGGDYGEFWFYGGFVYYKIDPFTEEDGGAFVRTNLETGESELLFEDYFRPDRGLFPVVSFSGELLYFTGWEGATRDVNQRAYSLYRYDLRDGTLERLCDWTLDYWIMEDGVVYTYRRADGAFYEYDLKTGELRQAAKPDLGLGAAYYDRDYIYLKCWNWEDAGVNELYIFDREYRLIDHIHLKPGEDYLYRARDKLFFSSLPSGQITGMIPASEIGSGHMEIRRLPDPYSIR